MPSRISKIMTAAALIAGAVGAPGHAEENVKQDARAHPSPRNLFIAEGADVNSPTPHHPEILRERFVSFDPEQMPDPRQTGTTTILLDLFDDLSVDVVLDRAERDDTNRTSRYGTVRGYPGSSVVLTQSGGALSGRINIPGRGEYEIYNAGGDEYRVEQIDESELDQGCGNHEIGSAPPPSLAAAGMDGVAGTLACNHDDGSTVDVLIVYTSAAANAAGGASAIEARAQLLVDVANDAYARSGVLHRLRLVDVAPTTYDEDGTIGDHRQRLTSDGDGIMDDVHDIRDEYGADLVSLLYDQHTDKECKGGSTPKEPCTDDSECGKLCDGGDNDGDACTDDGDCGSVCIGGANEGSSCDRHVDCPGGGTCSGGRCDGGTNDGNPCNVHVQCPSNDGLCVSSACDGGDRDGENCTVDADCDGNDGICDGVCRGSCGLKFTGLAWQMTELSHAFESNAFSVCKWDSTDWLLAHESAHNQGCGHDRDNVQSGGLYSYSWGQRIVGLGNGTCKGGSHHGEACANHGDCPGGGFCKRGVCNIGGEAGDDCADDSDCPPLCLGGSHHGDACSGDADCPGGTCTGICAQWKTVMAYAPGSSIDNFSNPAIAYDGAATGISIGLPGEANNAQTLNNSADTVANFRASNFWVDTTTIGFPFPPDTGCPDDPFGSLQDGIDATPKRGTLHVESASIGGPWTLSKPMRIEAENGSVLIGTK